MYACELMLSAGGGSKPARRAASRWISAKGTKRCGCPPMIARAIGRPSAPARAADGDPDRERVLHRTGMDTVLGRPVADREQLCELLREQPVVVAELVAEQR